jgi:hypothetical protein
MMAGMRSSAWADYTTGVLPGLAESGLDAILRATTLAGAAADPPTEGHR